MDAYEQGNARLPGPVSDFIVQKLRGDYMTREYDNPETQVIWPRYQSLHVRYLSLEKKAKRIEGFSLGTPTAPGGPQSATPPVSAYTTLRGIATGTLPVSAYIALRDIATGNPPISASTAFGSLAPIITPRGTSTTSGGSIPAPTRLSRSSQLADTTANSMVAQVPNVGDNKDEDEDEQDMLNRMLASQKLGPGDDAGSSLTKAASLSTRTQIKAIPLKALVSLPARVHQRTLAPGSCDYQPSVSRVSQHSAKGKGRAVLPAPPAEPGNPVSCNHFVELDCDCAEPWTRWNLAHENAMQGADLKKLIHVSKYVYVSKYCGMGPSQKQRQLYFCVRLLYGRCKDPFCPFRHWRPERWERKWMLQTFLDEIQHMSGWDDYPPDKDRGYKRQPRLMRDGRWCYGLDSISSSVPAGEEDVVPRRAPYVHANRETVVPPALPTATTTKTLRIVDTRPSGQKESVDFTKVEVGDDGKMVRKVKLELDPNAKKYW
jgi:hypothetical protein